MENAAEALKMAAAVLIFVLALSISINAFTEVRQTSQIILDYKDREYDNEYIEGDNTERIVGAETIIPTVYKSYTENYKIIFEFKDDTVLYQKGASISELEDRNYIDLRKEALGSVEQRKQFIQAILYGYRSIDTDPVNQDKIFNNFKTRQIYLDKNPNGIYSEKLKNSNKYIEKLGVYYEEETYAGNENTPTANKTKKRIITYTEIYK